MKNFSMLFICALLFSSCENNFKKTIEISDLSKDQSERIEFDLKKGQHVEKLKINISGFINDTVRFKNYILVPKEVDTTFIQEWYSPDYQFEYQSINKSLEGHLKFDFEFVVI